jgi:enamine deaminase RidA (YjgF/YER057c/UK114 family)
MEKKPINPWEWAEKYMYSQAWRVDGASSVVVFSGQAPLSAEGDLVGEGDFEAQARQVFDNLETVLGQAGASFDDVIKLTAYVTDMTKLGDYGRVRAEYLKGKRPAVTTVGVQSLAFPGMLIEVEALAVL